MLSLTRWRAWTSVTMPRGREYCMTWDERMITTVTTGTQLRDALLAVGLDPTDSCIVHTRLSAFGFIPGGEQTVVDVLKSVLYDGDIMMSAQTMDLSDSRYWGAPPVSPELIGTVNAALPAFNPETTPVHGIGRTPEYFRALPGTRRSSHPLYSMSAWGAMPIGCAAYAEAKAIMTTICRSVSIAHLRVSTKSMARCSFLAPGSKPAPRFTTRSPPLAGLISRKSRQSAMSMPEPANARPNGRHSARWNSIVTTISNPSGTTSFPNIPIPCAPRRCTKQESSLSPSAIW